MKEKEEWEVMTEANEPRICRNGDNRTDLQQQTGKKNAQRNAQRNRFGLNF